MSLVMVSEKLNELLRPPPDDGAKLPSLLTDASASSRTIEALHHFHKGPAFSTESQKTVRIVMGKMVQLAFEVSSHSDPIHHIPSHPNKPNPDPLPHARHNRSSNNAPLHPPPKQQSLPPSRSLPLATNNKAILTRSLNKHNAPEHGQTLLSLHDGLNALLPPRNLLPTLLLRLLARPNSPNLAPPPRRTPLPPRTNSPLVTAEYVVGDIYAIARYSHRFRGKARWKGRS